MKLEAVPASGPRVTKSDVRDFVAGGAAAPAPAAGQARGPGSAATGPPVALRAIAPRSVCA